jgi:hypothetical protein
VRRRPEPGGSRPNSKTPELAFRCQSCVTSSSINQLAPRGTGFGKGSTGPGQDAVDAQATDTPGAPSLRSIVGRLAHAPVPRAAVEPERAPVFEASSSESSRDIAQKASSHLLSNIAKFPRRRLCFQSGQQLPPICCLPARCPTRWRATASARCPRLPADAAPAALDRRRPGPSKDPSCGCVVHVVVRSNGMARRTQVSTVGKEPDPFVIRAAGDCYETPPARGCAPRVVAVGATQRGDAATHASRLLHNKSPLDSRAGTGGRWSSTSSTRSRRFGIARFASTRAQRRLRRGRRSRCSRSTSGSAPNSNLRPSECCAAPVDDRHRLRAHAAHMGTGGVDRGETHERNDEGPIKADAAP